MTAPGPTWIARLLVAVTVGTAAAPAAAHQIHNGSLESGINPTAPAPTRRLPIDPGPVGDPLAAGTAQASQGVPPPADPVGLPGWWHAGGRGAGHPTHRPGRPWWWGLWGSRPRPFPAVASAAAAPMYPDPGTSWAVAGGPDGGVGTIEKAPVWVAGRVGGESAASGSAAVAVVSTPGPGGLALGLAGLAAGIAGRRCCRGRGPGGKNSPSAYHPPPR